jgi:DNA-binding MarR family transcriptional regulator
MSEMPIDFNGLDTTVHGPVRLGALTALHMNGPMDFTSLKKQLQVSDGTLGMHLQKLEEVGYLKGSTVLIGRRPRTTYRLTASGRNAFANYLDAMRKLLDTIEPHRAARSE